MTTTQHGRAEGHEVGDTVVAIANQLLQVVGDEGLRVDVSELRMYMLVGGPDARLGEQGGRSGSSKLTVASEWFSLTPLARRRWARKPSCEIASLSSCRCGVYG